MANVIEISSSEDSGSDASLSGSERVFIDSLSPSEEEDTAASQRREEK